MAFISKRTAIFAMSIVVSSGAFAQPAGWPNKPVKIVMPFAAGDTVDIISLVFEQLCAALGQPFITDNRPGVGGNVDPEEVEYAPNSGYTLLISGAPARAVNAHPWINLSYESISDMTSILPSAPLPAETAWFLAMTEQITHQSLSVKYGGIGLPGAAGNVPLVD